MNNRTRTKSTGSLSLSIQSQWSNLMFCSHTRLNQYVGWNISPLRCVVSFQHFVKVNRTMIKVTHFPILSLMLAYKRLTLSYYNYQPVALAGQHAISENRRVREPSTVTYQNVVHLRRSSDSCPMVALPFVRHKQA